jgi:hypothetical protein
MSSAIALSIKSESVPPINVIEYPLCFCCRVFCLDVIIDPGNKVILEATLDQLV